MYNKNVNSFIVYTMAGTGSRGDYLKNKEKEYEKLAKKVTTFPKQEIWRGVIIKYII